MHDGSRWYNGLVLYHYINIPIIPCISYLTFQIITQIGGIYEASKTYLGATDARDAWE